MSECFFADKLKDVDHSQGVQYCSLCDKSLCDNCRHNYKERLKAAFDEKVKRNPIVRKIIKH
jgi:hypothetical protein